MDVIVRNSGLLGGFILTSGTILSIEAFKARLPKLSQVDAAYVIGHLVALETAGIPGDAPGEKQRLERLILQFGFHLAYFRYVELMVGKLHIPKTYDDWAKGFR